MEKRADYEIKITKRNGQLMMQLPGSDNEFPYDSRFPFPINLEEGESYITPKGD